MKTTKTFFLATTVLLLIVFATSCIPTVPGGNPTPSNGFDVNLNDISQAYDATRFKILAVDGDSILFAIFYSSGGWGNQRHISIGYKSTTGNQYEFYAGRHNGNNALHTLAAGVTVSGTADAGHEWIPFAQQVWFDTRFDKEILLNEDISVDFAYIWNDIPDLNRYIVFRKLKGSEYQYYWLKVGSSKLEVFGFPGIYTTFATFINNGKFQMNSITTGQ